MACHHWISVWAEADVAATAARAEVRRRLRIGYTPSLMDDGAGKGRL